MLCQKCNRNEATIHVTRIIYGKEAEYHYCSHCAVDTEKYHSITYKISNKSPESEKKVNLLAELKKLANNFPDDPTLLYGLGKKYVENEMYDDAIQTYQKITYPKIMATPKVKIRI